MWRIICLGFFGVFAWGMTWDMYGTRILEHYHRIVDIVQAGLNPSSHSFLLLLSMPSGICQEAEGAECIAMHTRVIKLWLGFHQQSAAVVYT